MEVELQSNTQCNFCRVSNPGLIVGCSTGLEARHFFIIMELPKIERGNEGLEELPDAGYLLAIEEKYRKGYLHGMLKAVEIIKKAKRAGYSRPHEVANIIEAHAANSVSKWCMEAESENPLVRMNNEPKFDIEPWREMRNETFKRDSHKCQKCGSEQNLECHHIEPVVIGGFAELDNLMTLCNECHKTETFKR